MAGMVLFGAALGGGLALSWAFSYQRFGPSNPRLLALGLALVGFLVMSLMPGLKYPPNPPAVGNPETIGYRTELYFVMMLLSIGIVIAAAWLSHQLIPRLGRGNAMMWATLFAVALMLVVCALMPTVNEVPEHFPADLLWRFRISSFRHAPGALERHRCGVRCLSRTHAGDRCAAPSLPPRLTHHESVANVDLSGRNGSVPRFTFPL